jgi:hypothetical protein
MSTLEMVALETVREVHQECVITFLSEMRYRTGCDGHRSLRFSFEGLFAIRNIET